MKKSLHYLIFDGTSYYVGDKEMTEQEDGLQIIKESNDFDLLSAMADKANEEI